MKEIFRDSAGDCKRSNKEQHFFFTFKTLGRKAKTKMETISIKCWIKITNSTFIKDLVVLLMFLILTAGEIKQMNHISRCSNPSRTLIFHSKLLRLTLTNRWKEFLTFVTSRVLSKAKWPGIKSVKA